MNSILYKAAMKGQVDVLRQHIGQLDGPITPNHNTLLHLAVQFGQLECTELILQEHPSLAPRVNIKGENPLHIAAREGYADIVKKLIECANKLEQEPEGGSAGATKEMLRATNVDGDMALHMAVRNCHFNVKEYFEVKEYLEVVRLLTREDSEFQYPANSAEKTPLYLAVELGYQAVKVVDVLLIACKSLSYKGPSGRTALHVAALKDVTGLTIQRLSEWKQDLIKEADVYGWIPIHYASYAGNKKGVEQLLKMDISNDIASATTANEDGLYTALHIAATNGHVDVMEMLLSNSPGCWELVNSRGQNIFHIAIDMEREDVLNFIFKKSWLRHLTNQKDHKGNTPFDMILDSEYWTTSLWRHARLAKGYASDEDAIFFSSLDGRGNIIGNALGNVAKMKGAYKKKKEAQEQREQARKKEVEKMAKTHMIVATLTTTITFAAAFAIPGGYDGNKDPEQGMAVLSRTTAFKAFLVTNTIAMACSVSSVFLYLIASLYIDVEDRVKKEKRYEVALCLILVGMISMMLAFITATFAVLAHSLALPIATCIIACITLVVFFVKFCKAVSVAEQKKKRGYFRN